MADDDSLFENERSKPQKTISHFSLVIHELTNQSSMLTGAIHKTFFPFLLLCIVGEEHFVWIFSCLLISAYALLMHISFHLLFKYVFFFFFVRFYSGDQQNYFLFRQCGAEWFLTSGSDACVCVCYCLQNTKMVWLWAHTRNDRLEESKQKEKKQNDKRTM